MKTFTIVTDANPTITRTIHGAGRWSAAAALQAIRLKKAIGP
jgi:hypothetical protein